MSNKIVLWKSNSDLRISEGSTFPTIVNKALQLREKEKSSIISAYEAGHYLMVSNLVWTKCLTSLKSQLSKLGLTFIGEMLDRPDITEYSNIHQVITDYDAILLAEQLGILTDTSSLRLKRAIELINHYNNPEKEISDEEDFTKQDAEEIVRSSVQAILGHQNVEFALDFKKFRSSLESETLDESNIYVQRVLSSPYFFLRATVRVLLAIIKGSTGAQLEISLGNANLIIPKIWEDLNKPEKYQLGRCYAEAVNDGKTIAASGLKKVLLKVKGFDYVPEDLRSNSFSKVGHEILNAHFGSNNFYNEAAPVKNLASMGSVIPINAFPVCLTAILCVKMGNSYGTCWAAQSSANEILQKITGDRWLYFFDEVLPNEENIILKLTNQEITERWINLIKENKKIEEIVDSIKNKDTKKLIGYTLRNQIINIRKTAEELYKSLKS